MQIEYARVFSSLFFLLKSNIATRAHRRSRRMKNNEFDRQHNATGRHYSITWHHKRVPPSAC
jgi:hypothetical protein